MIKIFFILSALLLALVFTDAGLLEAEKRAYAQDIIGENNASAETANKPYHINIDLPTIKRGYTVSAFNEVLKLSLTPGILTEATDVDLLEMNESMAMPWRLDLASQVYQYEFKNKKAYASNTPFYIQLAYKPKNNDLKQVFFYDKNYSSWRPLPTKDFPDNNFVRSLIYLPYARLAVFSYPGIMTSGRASWYGYKNGDFTASPDFPKGSRLRVTNQDNGRFVDVVVNDYGPDRGLHPDRALDLDKVAFKKLAPLSSGMIDVKVTPLSIPRENGMTLAIPDAGVGEYPKITSTSTVIMAESDSRVIWEKNSTTTQPLASLTKIVAVYVFLTTKPNLNTVVPYDLQDEKFNNEYCEPWESAKLALKPGETLTVGDLVYSSLVGSTNNTVESLVRASGLSRPDFIKKMNEIVFGWGAVNTEFIEPTGLSPANVSSALDYAIITKEALKHPILSKISAIKEYRFTTINRKIAHRIKNTNSLIKQNKYHITGSKTGYLDEAGYCLMTRVKAADGQNIIIVNLGTDNRETSYQEIEELLIYGLKKYNEKNF